MRIKHITVVVEPLQPDEVFVSKSFSKPKSVHESANYTQLVDELKEQTEATVTLVHDNMKMVPLEGFVILYPRSRGFFFEKILNGYEPQIQKTLPRRIVLLNLAPAEAHKILSRYSLAAIVEDMDYRHWWEIENTMTQRQNMYGLTSVAKEIGANVWNEITTAIFSEKEHYCYMAGETLERLPTLLIRYLEAYVRIFPEVLQ